MLAADPPSSLLPLHTRARPPPPRPPTRHLFNNPFTSIPCDWGVNTTVTTSLVLPSGVSLADCIPPPSAPPTASDPPPTADVPVQRDVGTCDAPGMSFIDSLEGCSAAAAALGLIDVDAHDISFGATDEQLINQPLLPYGCYYMASHPADRQLLFNPNGHTGGSNDQDRRSICLRTEGYTATTEAATTTQSRGDC